mgnify:FL=1
MLKQIKMNYMHWQMWLRLAFIPIVWLLVAMEYAGEHGRRKLNLALPNIPKMQHDD